MKDLPRGARVLALWTATATVGAMSIALPTSAGAQPAAGSGQPGPHTQLSPRTAHAQHAKAKAAWRREREVAHFAAARPAVPEAASSTTFAVNTTDDTPLADPTSTTCADASGNCSLRAAVEAANNLAQPVRIALDAQTYTLTSGTELDVTNPAGTSILGKGAASTTIAGAASRILSVASTDSSSPSALLFVNSVTLTKGAADKGAAVYLASHPGATAVLDHVTITGNDATSEGGGVYADNGNTVYLTHGSLTHNTAPEGGGLYADFADIELIDETVEDNATTAGAPGSGGGMYVSESFLGVDGGSISNNTAGDTANAGSGGGMYSSYTTLEFTDVKIDGNTAQYGGAGGGLDLSYPEANITGGSISNNTAAGSDGYGGGIYFERTGDVGLHGVTMAGDTTAGTADDAYGGGAIYDYGSEYGNQLTVDSGSKITGADNGAVYLYSDYGQTDVSITDSTLQGNVNASRNFDGDGCGAAICAYAHAYGGINLQVARTAVANNRNTSGSGGGAMSVLTYEYASASVQLTGNTFRNNSTGPGGAGGALSLYDDDDYTPISVRMSHNLFVGNRAGGTDSGAQGEGGAIYAGYYLVLTDVGSTFRNNQAIGDASAGGAISSEYNEESMRFTGTRFIGNSAGANGNGGAVYSYESYGGDVFTDVTMSGNHATYGGAVAGSADNAALLFNGSTISGNTAGSDTEAGQGGGIYGYERVVKLINSTVAGNTAASVAGTAGQGGGIWAQDSRVGLRYSTVAGNVAQQGGGVYTQGQSGTLLGSIVAGNRVASNGAEQDCASGAADSVLSSIGRNVLGQRACANGLQTGDVVAKQAGLRTLAANGGPTPTLGLQAGSPAIGRGGYACPATDQRGVARTGTRCDAGAYEWTPGVVRAVSPHSGTRGTKITITGSGFTFAKAVVIGGRHARHRVLSDTSLIAWAPPHGAGKVSVAVLTPDGAGHQGSFVYSG